MSTTSTTQKIWKLLKHLIAIVICLLVAAASLLIWLGSRHTSPVKIVGNIGGHEILSSNTSPLNSDLKYLKSLAPQKTHNIKKENTNNDMCNSPSWECVEANIITANVILAGGVKLEPALRNKLEQYRKSTVAHEMNCPAKLEITLMLDALQAPEHTDPANNLANKRKQTLTLTNTLWSPGSPFNLDTLDCRTYFSERPYLAQLYVRRFADLTLKAEGELDREWLELIRRLPKPETT